MGREIISFVAFLWFFTITTLSILRGINDKELMAKIEQVGSGLPGWVIAVCIFVAGITWPISFVKHPIKFIKKDILWIDTNKQDKPSDSDDPDWKKYWRK